MIPGRGGRSYTCKGEILYLGREEGETQGGDTLVKEGEIII